VDLINAQIRANLQAAVHGLQCSSEADMSASTDISILYREFTDSLTAVLAETAGAPVRRGRLARAHTAVKRHANYNEHEYSLAVETAFTQWEAMQNVGH
jgi:hypothetical protein